jgi:hypothetical protein
MDCTISATLQNKLFDHRACFLDFEKKFFRQAIVSVKNKILNDDIIDLILFSTCAEAYAIHAAADSLPVPERREILQKVGTLKQLLRDIGPPIIPPEQLVLDNGTGFMENRQRLLREAELCKDDIDLPRLEAVNLEPDQDIFFETLTGMLKNELISYQSYAAKVGRLQVNNLHMELEQQKKDLPANFERIAVLEKKTRRNC